MHLRSGCDTAGNVCGLTGITKMFPTISISVLLPFCMDSVFMYLSYVCPNYFLHKIWNFLFFIIFCFFFLYGLPTCLYSIKLLAAIYLLSELVWEIILFILCLFFYISLLDNTFLSWQLPSLSCLCLLPLLFLSLAVLFLSPVHSLDFSIAFVVPFLNAFPITKVILYTYPGSLASSQAGVFPFPCILQHFLWWLPPLFSKIHLHMVC